MDNNKNYGLIEGRSYVHGDHPEWGHGLVFTDKTGNLKINFSIAGVKSVLNGNSASKLSLLPSRFRCYNKPAKLSDGQLVVIMSGDFSRNGDEVYTVFRETEPRIMHVREELTPVEAKSQAALSLMNDFFKVKKNLPLNTNAIRMSTSRARRTSCYNCRASGLDNSTDFECAACGWIICPACGACGCGYV